MPATATYTYDPVDDRPPAAPLLIDPDLARAETLVRLGRPAEAEPILLDLTRRFPGHVRAARLLGQIAFTAGRSADALRHFTAVARLDAQAASCAGVVCQALGRLDEAEAWHRQAAERAPADAFVLSNFGAALANRGHFAEAADVLTRARTLNPADGEAQTNLAGVLRSLRRVDEALAAGMEAVRLAPGLSQAHNNLGNVLLDLGRLDRARGCFEEAARLNPRLAEAHRGLGEVAVRQRRGADAARAFGEAAALRPADAALRDSLAQALLVVGRVAEAHAAAREAVRLAPAKASARNTLGNCLIELGDLDAAAAAYEEAQALAPDWSTARYNLGICRQRQGRLDVAFAALRAALAANPDDVIGGSSYAGLLFYDPTADAAALLAEHRRWGERHAPAVTAPPPANGPDPDRPLRVGYLSPDFRNHAVAFFLQPILANHDPRQVEAICYAEVPVADPRTAELRGLARGWRETQGLADEELAALVRRDGIDVLVELAGHLAGSRLRVLARRPAPVQVSYLGYPGTTGLPYVDYRITDATTDPPGAEAGYSEELVRLPGCFCCYAPPPPLPVEPQPPSLRAGAVTFGSLHKLEKLNPRVVDLWCDVLRDVPGSRILLARNYLRGGTADYWRAEFARRGIGPDRLKIEAPVPMAMGHLRLYDRIDVALDPFPWGGHTTACEALWMGVPTVTLLGDRYSGRMVASVLNAVGLPELVAATPDEYRRVARDLAADEPRRAALRANLRDRLAASPVCDGRTFTRGLEGVYRQLWRRWCEDRAGVPVANTEEAAWR